MNTTNNIKKLFLKEDILLAVCDYIENNYQQKYNNKNIDPSKIFSDRLDVILKIK
jgi:hypothetical protein